MLVGPLEATSSKSTLSHPVLRLLLNLKLVLVKMSAGGHPWVRIQIAAIASGARMACQQG